MTEGEEKPKEGSTAGASENQSPQAPDIEALDRNLNAVQLERLTSLYKALQETENRIDQKLSNFKKFVDNTEIQGRGLAGGALPKPDPEKEKKDAANKLLAGTGLSID